MGHAPWSLLHPKESHESQTDEAGLAPKCAKKTYSSYVTEDRKVCCRTWANQRYLMVPESTALSTEETVLGRVGAGTVWRFQFYPQKCVAVPFYLRVLWMLRWESSYAISLWATSGVVNAAILVAAAEGIVAAADCSLLRADKGRGQSPHRWQKRDHCGSSSNTYWGRSTSSDSLPEQNRNTPPSNWVFTSVECVAHRKPMKLQLRSSYADKILLSFVKKKRDVMGLEKNHPCLTILMSSAASKSLHFACFSRTILTTMNAYRQQKAV